MVLLSGSRVVNKIKCSDEINVLIFMRNCVPDLSNVGASYLRAVFFIYPDLPLKMVFSLYSLLSLLVPGSSLLVAPGTPVPSLIGFIKQEIGTLFYINPGVYPGEV